MPDQIRARVSFICGGKLAERLYVMNRETITNMFSAAGTVALLFSHNYRPNGFPSPASVCCLSSNPMRRLRSRAIFSPKHRFAFKRTELTAMPITKTPCLLLEGSLALLAGKQQRRQVLRVIRPDHDRRFCVKLRIFPNAVHPRYILTPEALSGAKSLSMPSRGRNHHYGRAGFAGFWTTHVLHGGTISYCGVNTSMTFGGSGTTGLVADRLQRDAVLIELNSDYVAMARRRISGDAPLFEAVQRDV
jgi:hypothetical protein